MPMHDMGLTKLQEECGELVQASAKLASMIEHGRDGPDRIDTRICYTHYDGHDLKAALEDEIADVRAAIFFTCAKHRLDTDRIWRRVEEKLALFEKWDSE